MTRKRPKTKAMSRVERGFWDQMFLITFGILGKGKSGLLLEYAFGQSLEHADRAIIARRERFKSTTARGAR